MKRSVVLIGYRGVGKSTIARLLADRLGLEAISTDAMVVHHAGMPIAAITAQFGWPRFRELERAEVARAAQGKPSVIDTGGGAVMDPVNAAALHSAGPVILLTASQETILRRISGDAARPPLVEGRTLEEEVAEKLAERGPVYRRLADFVISSDVLSPGRIAQEIAARCF